jgi:hypothetical protein
MSSAGVPWLRKPAYGRLTITDSSVDTYTEDWDGVIYLPVKKKWRIPEECALISIKPKFKARDQSIDYITNTQELNGKIGLCHEETIDNIDRVIQLAGLYKACGVIASKPPTRAIRIPVVVLDNSTISNLAKYAVKVTVHVAEEELATHPSGECLSQNTKFDSIDGGQCLNTADTTSEVEIEMDVEKGLKPKENPSDSCGKSDATCPKVLIINESVEILHQDHGFKQHSGAVDMKQSTVDEPCAKCNDLVLMKKQVQQENGKEDNGLQDQLGDAGTSLAFSLKTEESFPINTSGKYNQPQDIQHPMQFLETCTPDAAEIFHIESTSDNNRIQDCAQDFSAELSPKGMHHREDGIVNKAIKIVSNLLTKKTDIQVKFEKILEQGTKWSEEKNFSSFIAAVDLHSTLSSNWKKREEERKSLIQTTRKFMECQKFHADALFLSFSVFLYYQCKNDNAWHYQQLLYGLKIAIFECISNFNPCSFGPKLKDLPLSFPLEARCKRKPCCTLSCFIADSLNSNPPYKIESSEMMIKILWALYYHCNEEHISSFPSLTLPEGKDLTVSERHILESFLEETMLHSTLLCLQPSFEKFRIYFLKIVQSDVHVKCEEKVVVTAPVFNHVIRLIEDYCTRQMYDLLCDEMDHLVAILAIIRCKSNNDKMTEKIFEKIVKGLDYQKCGTFKFLNKVFCSVNETHPHNELVQKKILENLCHLLQTRENNWYHHRLHLQMMDAESLFKLPLMRLLLVHLKGRKAIFAYTTEAMKVNKHTVKEKLEFLSKVYEACVAKDVTLFIPDFETEMQHWLIGLIQHANNVQFLIKTFEFAEKNPAAFSHPNGACSILKWLAKSITSLETASSILAHPRLLVWEPQTNITPNSLLSFLIQELLESLICQCREIEQAIALFTYWCLSGVKKSSILENIAEQVLLSYFWKTWKPTNISDILSVGSENLLKFYGCLKKEPCTDEREKSTEHLISITKKWHKAFTEDNVTITEIASLILPFSKGCSDVLKNMCVMEEKFPTHMDIKRKLEEFERLKSLIHSNILLSVAENEATQSISAILFRYNVTLDFEPPLQRILTKYSSEFTNSESDIENATTLSEMQSDCKYIVEFRKDHNELLHIASFFLQAPSIFFRDALGYGSWTHLSPEEFFDKVRMSKQLLEGMFCGADFKKIIERVQLILKIKGDLHKETILISQCPGIYIKETERDNFCTVALLYQISGHLKQFINCCQQFKFGFIDEDPTFHELSELTKYLDSEAALAWSVSQCLAIAKQISHILLSFNIRGKSLYKELNQCLSLLQVFSTLSTNSDVWSLVQDMKWFGKEGLQRFYQEYDNVTNMFLGDSESFEMSVLLSLEPCIRCISSFLYEERSLELFLKSTCISDKAVALDDFKVVQSNVSSIRDWFTTGMDDIAAIFGIFKQISLTGKYFIKAANGQGPDMLCLQYRKTDKNVDQNKRTEMEVMEQETLNDFVERLGFIQHESKSLSEKVDCFIGQHRMILGCVELLLQMSNIGFPIWDLQSFSFEIPEKTLLDAKYLMSEANKKWQECEKWLENLYSEYPVTLLFWIEELKEIYLLIKKIDLERKSENMMSKLIHAASRIFPAEKCNDYRFLSDVTRNSIMKFSSVLEKKEGSWLATTSKYLNHLHNENENCSSGTQALSRNFVTSSSEIILHTLSCNEVHQKEAVINLIKYIYVVS